MYMNANDHICIRIDIYVAIKLVLPKSVRRCRKGRNRSLPIDTYLRVHLRVYVLCTCANVYLNASIYSALSPFSFLLFYFPISSLAFVLVSICSSETKRSKSTIHQADRVLRWKLRKTIENVISFAAYEIS